MFGRHRGLGAFFLARTVSILGSAASIVVMPVLVYSVTNSPFMTSLVSTMNGIVYLGLGLPAGAWADGANRKVFLISSEAASAAIYGILALGLVLNRASGWMLIASAFLASVAFAFYDAGNYGQLTSLVGRDDLVRAHGLMSTVSNACQILGPAIAGVLLAIWGPVGGIALNAVSYVVAAVLLAFVPASVSESRGGAIGDGIKAGLRFIWDNEALRLLTVSICILALAEGAIFGQLAVFLASQYGFTSSDSRYGWFMTVVGVGTLVGSFAVATLELNWTATWRMVLPTALLPIGVPLAPNWVMSALLAATWGGLFMWVLVGSTALRQRLAPDSFQSRVAVVGRLAGSGVGKPAGALGAAWLTFAVGSATAVSLVCLLSAIGLSVVWLVSRNKGAASGPEVVG